MCSIYNENNPGGDCQQGFRPVGCSVCVLNEICNENLHEGAYANMADCVEERVGWDNGVNDDGLEDPRFEGEADEDITHMMTFAVGRVRDPYASITSCLDKGDKTENECFMAFHRSLGGGLRE